MTDSFSMSIFSLSSPSSSSLLRHNILPLLNSFSTSFKTNLVSTTSSSGVDELEVIGVIGRLDIK